MFEFGFAHSIVVTEALYLDSLSLLMAFIIGVIGSGICVYALGYMEDFQDHEPAGAKDRRHVFFALMFVFLSAMFVIVFSEQHGVAVHRLGGHDGLLVPHDRLHPHGRGHQERLPPDHHEPARRPGLPRGALPCAIRLGTLSFLEFLQTASTTRPLVVLPDARFRSRASRRPRRCRSTGGSSAPWWRRRPRRRCSTPPRWSRPACSCW